MMLLLLFGLSFYLSLVEGVEEQKKLGVKQRLHGSPGVEQGLPPPSGGMPPVPDQGMPPSPEGMPPPGSEGITNTGATGGESFSNNSSGDANNINTAPVDVESQKGTGMYGTIMSYIGPSYWFPFAEASGEMVKEDPEGF